MEAIIPSSSLLFTPPSLYFSSSSLLFFLFIHFSSLHSSPFLSTSLLFLIPLNSPAKYASSSCVGARDSSLSAASTHLRIARTGIYL